MGKIERTRVNGINSSEDRLEFLNAVDALCSPANHRIRTYETVSGTIIALAKIIKISKSKELIEKLVNIFNAYGCEFEASWIWDDLDSDYKAKIDLSYLPVNVSKEIITLSKKIEKKNRKEELQVKKLKIKEMKKAIALKKEESKKVVNKLKKYRR